MTRMLRIVVIAPARHALREPHAGGLERMVWERVRSLRERGHEVLLCAPEGSDLLDGSPPELVLPAVRWPDARSASDTTYPTGHLEGLDGAVRGAVRWMAAARERIDVIDNHSLHGIVLDAAATLDVPIVTTLHTPPLPEVIAAHRRAPNAPHSFLAVSEHTRAAWVEHGVAATVLPNTFADGDWSLGRGGGGLVWSGRIVPEKAPHLALEAARLAGLPIVLAGRVGDQDYYEREVLPRLGGGARYVGELGQRDLDRLVGAADCALVTPMWPEPFGLVVAEALATGTPVAAFGSGGVAEVVAGAPWSSVVEPGDVVALARAATRLAARGSDPAVRAAVREHAMLRYSASARMPELEARLRAALLPAEVLA